MSVEQNKKERGVAPNKEMIFRHGAYSTFLRVGNDKDHQVACNTMRALEDATRKAYKDAQCKAQNLIYDAFGIPYTYNRSAPDDDYDFLTKILD